MTVAAPFAPSEAVAATPRCPLCGAQRFGPYRGRENARCAGCGAKERERLMALALAGAPLDARGLPVWHLAPERSVATLLMARFGPLYRAGDLDPAAYAGLGAPVERVDLRRPLERFAPGGVGGFVHSHVLEHIPASLDRVIGDMNRALAPGGFHVFQAPIHNGWYREDMDPDMPPATRAERFYQDDHMRVFGAQDFAERVLSLFDGFDAVDLSATIPLAALAAAMVPGTALRHFTGHSVFIFIKR